MAAEGQGTSGSNSGQTAVSNGSGGVGAGEIEARGGKGFYVTSDLTRDEDIDRLIKEAVGRCGRIDILVNNSGISPFVKKSEEVTKEMWQDVLQVNLLAPFMLCREAAKIMMILYLGAHSIARTFVISISAAFVAQ